MAFVIRSPKRSPFQQIHTSNVDEIAPQLTKDDRIHHDCENHFRKIVNTQKHKKNKLSEEPSIPDCSRIFQPIRKQYLQRFQYNLQNVRKYKVAYKINQTLESIQKKDVKQYYDLPGSLSPNTMVKYVNKISNKIIKPNNTSTPGPGTYTPKIDHNIQTPVFYSQAHPQPQKILKTIQDSEQEKEQNLFAVKYNYMNSSVFKKCPNLLKRSNKILLTKLFYDKNSQEKNSSELGYNYLNLKDQFDKIESNDPGPAHYNRQTSLHKMSASAFGKAERFLDQLSDGSNKYYNLPNKEYNSNPTPCFSSLAERFEDGKPFPTSLQYTNYEQSLIRQSKNRKNVSFNSNIVRSEENQTDERLFYCLDTTNKKQILTKFSKNGQERVPFALKNQQSPSPTDYYVNCRWIKESGCVISKGSKGQTQSYWSNMTNQKFSKFFCLCSEKSLKVKAPKSKKLHIRPGKLTKLDNKQKESKMVDNKQKNDYYDVNPNWQIKSFNRCFSKEQLPANNPTQYRIQ